MPDQTDRTQISVRVPLRLKAELEREADEIGVSRSQHIRNTLADRERVDELRERLERREERIEQLEDQLRKRSRVEDKVDTLAKRVEDTDGPTPPFPVRWWRWIRSRGDSSAGSEPAD